MTELQQTVYDWFLKYKSGSPHEIAIGCGYTESAYIFGSLRYLIKKKLIHKRGEHKGVRYLLSE